MTITTPHGPSQLESLLMESLTLARVNAALGSDFFSGVGVQTITAGTASQKIPIVGDPAISVVLPTSSTGTSGIDLVFTKGLNNVTINDPKTPVTLDFSHLSGNSAVTDSLPAGNEAFTYDGVTVHITNSTQPIQLIGVSAHDISFLPAHS